MLSGGELDYLLFVTAARCPHYQHSSPDTNSRQYATSSSLNSASSRVSAVLGLGWAEATAGAKEDWVRGSEAAGSLGLSARRPAPGWPGRFWQYCRRCTYRVALLL